jgi:DNA-binding PadR family transcriptional regulator
VADLQMTKTRQLVLGALLNAPGELYLSEVAELSGVPAGSADRALVDLLRHGFLESRHEAPGVRAGRPRRYYRLTPEGARRVRDLLYGSDGDGRTTG